MGRAAFRHKAETRSSERHASPAASTSGGYNAVAGIFVSSGFSSGFGNGCPGLGFGSASASAASAASAADRCQRAAGNRWIRHRRARFDAHAHA
jgi:hypothetical protein